MGSTSNRRVSFGFSADWIGRSRFRIFLWGLHSLGFGGITRVLDWEIRDLEGSNSVRNSLSDCVGVFSSVLNSCVGLRVVFLDEFFEDEREKDTPFMAVPVCVEREREGLAKNTRASF